MKGKIKMHSFIENLSKIKMTKIAKLNKLEYTNIKTRKAKKDDIDFFEKEIKKRIIALFLIENLNEKEKSSIINLSILIKQKLKENDILFTIDQRDVIDIYNLLKIFEVYYE